MIFKGIFPSKQKIIQKPNTVILETTNACNLRCKMCHVYGSGVHRSREKGFMPETLWLKAIDEIAEWDKTVNVALHGAGEPILHKYLIQILRYAVSKKNINAGFLTNGTLLTRDIIRAILDAGISWIGFSVDGADPDLYEKYRGTDLSAVEKNIETLLSMRQNYRPTVFLNMVALPDGNPDMFVKRWLGKADEIKISKYRPAGHRDFLEEKTERLPCYLLNDMLVMTWNGKVVLCCEDIWADEIIGDFYAESLLDIWNSKKMHNFRALHKNGKASEIPICKDCDGWANVLTKTVIDNEANIKITTSPSQTSYSILKR